MNVELNDELKRLKVARTDDLSKQGAAATLGAITPGAGAKGAAMTVQEALDTLKTAIGSGDKAATDALATFKETVNTKQTATDRVIAELTTAVGTGTGSRVGIATKAELKTTHLARAFPYHLAVCTDQGVPFTVLSDATNWRRMDGSIFSTDPVIEAWSYERGCALSGLERSEKDLPGVEGTHYQAPKLVDMQYQAAQGFTVVRLPFLWERAQPDLMGDLDPIYISYIDKAFTFAKQLNMRILLDCHNYGAYNIDGVRYPVGSPTVPYEALGDLWRRLAERYSLNSALFGYDIMNEPHSMPVPQSPWSYNTNVKQVQVVINPCFDGAFTDNWTLDSNAYSIAADPERAGGYMLHMVGRDSQYDNFTTANSASQGYEVEPNTVYAFSVERNYKVTSGRGPVIHINTGDAYGKGGVMLAQFNVNDSEGTWQRTTGTFTTGPEDTKVFIRLFNMGNVGVGDFRYFNITPGPRLREKTNIAFLGQYSTCSMMMQAGIDAIRKIDSTSWILVEMDRFAGVHEFLRNVGRLPEVWWHDPSDRTMLSMHYYFDPDHSGAYKPETGDWTAATRARMVDEVVPVLEWAKKKGIRVFIGEYGIPPDTGVSATNYLADMETFLTLLDRYLVYGAVWASGQGFTSQTTIQAPGNDYTKAVPAMAVYKKHLSKSKPA